MNDQAPSTPRPKLTPISSEAAPPPGDPRFADTEPILDELLASGERRMRDPLGAACTLVWLAHTTLLEISQGTLASREEWTATRAVVESAVRYLVLAQAQRIVDSRVPYPRGPQASLLAPLRQLTTLVMRSKDARAHEGERVWQLAHRLELAVQCLYDWTAKSVHGAGSEEVFALARELQFVYRDLQPLARESG